MKRWLPLGAVLLGAAAVTVWLLTPAMAPVRFTGRWYDCRNGNAYTFHCGIVNTEGDTFAGAYSACRKKLLLFVSDYPDLEKERELQLVRSDRGDMLCDLHTGQPYFSREKGKTGQQP